MGRRDFPSTYMHVPTWMLTNQILKLLFKRWL
jgi:hypothetical protein